MRADYPLLLTPHLADRVWGGRMLGDGIGEAWDLSVHENGPSTITNGALSGKTLAEVSSASPADFGGPIALLGKRLDCAQNLSVQVHPKTGDPKTEAWVVLQAEEGAGVYHGFSQAVDPSTVRAAALDGSLPSLLRFLPVQTGQCVFVPSGTVHAIGGGLVLFELQQSADTTYRLFDWGREGRELHLDQGLACSDLVSVDALAVARPLTDGSLRLCACDYFFIDRVDAQKPVALDPGDTWVTVFLITGNARVGDLTLAPGATLMLPRAAGPASLEPIGACSALVYGPPKQ